MMAGREVEAKTEMKTDDVGFLGERVRDRRDGSSEGGLRTRTRFGVVLAKIFWESQIDSSGHPG